MAGREFPISPAPSLPDQKGQTLPELVRLMQRLLAEDGCPWDRAQTMESLAQYVLEEACEVIDAIESRDRTHLREELGDLLLQVVFLSELGRKEGTFGPDDVIAGIVEKLVRRHPHVFGDLGEQTKEEVEANWEKLKAKENLARPLLDNIPRSLPALEGARRISERAASVGFDWPDRTGSRQKVAEELGELDEAVAEGNQEAIEHELGDVLFALCNYARHLGIRPEKALQKTSLRFRRRFEYVEAEVREKHGDWPRKDGKATVGIPLEELDGYWNEAKKREVP